jgi:hypothetical protein
MNKIDDCACRDNPDADQETPEVVINRKRIFHPEDETITCQSDAVIE